MHQKNTNRFNPIVDLASARTRAIQKKLKDVETINNNEVQQILSELTNGELSDEE